jgi:hypothetical protein
MQNKFCTSRSNQLRLSSVGFSFGIFLLALFMGHCLAAVPNTCRVSEFGLIHTRKINTLILVCSARSELVDYDRLLATVPVSDRDPSFMMAMTQKRFDLLSSALSAYYVLGPVTLTSDSGQELYAQLSGEKLEYECFSMPATVDDLVQYGYLPHLPASPYPQGSWLTSAPLAIPEPGSMLYIPIPSKMPYLGGVAGLNEGWLLVAYGRDKDDVLSEKRVRQSFYGDLDAILPVIPTTALCILGQDVNTMN